MDNLIFNPLYFGIILTIIAYCIGNLVKKYFKLSVLNPLLIAIGVTLLVLLTFGVDYSTYNHSAKYLSYLLTPATVCLAVPLYEQYKVLRKNITAIMIGIASGVVTSLVTVLVLSLILKLGHVEYVTLLPKSITTAIGISLTEEMGGYVSITVASIIITGVFGNITGELICKVFNITHPVAKGIAYGTSSHVMGTSRAMEVGKVEGAMSSLSIVIAGLFTVIGSMFFSGLI